MAGASAGTCTDIDITITITVGRDGAIATGINAGTATRGAYVAPRLCAGEQHHLTGKGYAGQRNLEPWLDIVFLSPARHPVIELNQRECYPLQDIHVTAVLVSHREHCSCD